MIEVKRPYRDLIRHRLCGTLSAVPPRAAVLFKENPGAFTVCYCCGCKAERPVAEFTWDKDGKTVGS